VADVLIVGAGVIGSVYGAHLAAAGHEVSVPARGQRASDIERDGITVRNVNTGRSLRSSVTVVRGSGHGRPRLVLIAVQNEQLGSVYETLAAVRGSPTLLFFGNNPAGKAGIPQSLPGTVRLGFPGVAGQLKGPTVEYVVIPQQPTALEAAADPALDEIERALVGQGLPVVRVGDMDGWLLYHAVFIASVAAALHACGTEPLRLASDRGALSLMCRAVTEGFAALRREGVGGIPRNLDLLHRGFMRPFAIRYWARTMRSPLGELTFAAHARHAGGEMRSLADAVIAKMGTRPDIHHLQLLLESGLTNEER
jgi:2-dehydropantoate 2-reductase